MKSLNLKTKINVLFACVLTIATVLLAFANIIQPAQANETEYVTKIPGTALELVGNRPATSSDYSVAGDTVNFYASDLAIQGDGENYGLRLLVSKLTMRNLNVSSLYLASYNINSYDLTVESGYTASITDEITMPPDTPNVTVNFKGTGTIKTENIEFYSETTNEINMVLDGPKILINNTPQSKERAIWTEDNIFLKNGSLIITNSYRNGIENWWGSSGKVVIEDSCEVFISANYHPFSLNSKAECSEGTLFGSNEVKAYEQKDTINDVGAWAVLPNNEHVYQVNGENAKTVYHPSKVKPELTKVEVATMPTKTEYNVGDKFDPTGLTVTKYFDDETTETVTPKDSEISGFDSSTPGEKTVTVTCSDEEANNTVSTTFTVTILDNPEPEPQPESAPETTTPAASSQTGDSIPFAPLIAIFCLSAVALIALCKKQLNTQEM